MGKHSRSSEDEELIAPIILQWCTVASLWATFSTLKKKSVKIFQRSFLFKQNYSWCFVLIFFFFKESFGFSMCFLWKKCWEQVFSLLVMIPTPSSHCWHIDYKRLSSCLSHHQLFCSLYGNLPSTALLCMATL